MKYVSKNCALTVMLSLSLGPVVASAHHHRINFLDTTIAFHGEVTRLDWKNPHVYLYVAEQQEDGTVVTWEIETGSTPSLTRRGLTPDMLETGQLVTVRGNPDRNLDKKLMYASAVTKADGKTFVLQGRIANPDGEAVAQASSVAGVWQSLGSPYDRTQAAVFLPLTAKGEAAAAAFDVANDPFADCVPPPVPDSLSTPYLHEIIAGEDTVILREEYWEIDRIVYMDGRGHPVEGQRTNQGHSIGHWEGDVLVVDTTLFEDHGFGNGSGIPSGAGKHIVERYTLSNEGTTLTIEYVLEDPEYLSEPVTDTRQWRYAPQLELLPNECDLDIARRYRE